MKKLIKNNLLLKIILAIVLGSILGNYLPESISKIFITFNGIFGNFLDFIIPLIIVGLIIPAIGNIGNQAGKLLLITILIAYSSTLISGLMTYGVSIEVFPKLLENENIIEFGSENNLKPYFEIAMPPIFDVMSGLVFAFLMGVSISRLKGNYLKNVFEEFGEIIMKIIQKIIIPFLPLFIFGIFLNMTYSGQVFV